MVATSLYWRFPMSTPRLCEVRSLPGFHPMELLGYMRAADGIFGRRILEVENSPPYLDFLSYLRADRSSPCFRVAPSLISSLCFNKTGVANNIHLVRIRGNAGITSTKATSTRSLIHNSEIPKFWKPFSVLKFNAQIHLVASAIKCASFNRFYFSSTMDILRFCCVWLKDVVSDLSGYVIKCSLHTSFFKKIWKISFFKYIWFHRFQKRNCGPEIFSLDIEF